MLNLVESLLDFVSIKNMPGYFSYLHLIPFFFFFSLDLLITMLVFQLQDAVKDAMEMNKFTALLAHKEVAVFVVRIYSVHYFLSAVAPY